MDLVCGGLIRSEELACPDDMESANVGSMIAKSRLTVVYADDDDLVRETISRLLTDEGIDVHACEGGAEALALCRQMNPDVVLLDLNMPRPDGLETARQLRTHPGGGSLRLVALTGRGTWELRKKAMDAGFDEFLVKPISVANLIRALRPPRHPAEHSSG